MKFESSTLFVNTGRKPLPGMQKKKKNNKNNIVLGVCVAIIIILCIFVGLIVHIWASYDDGSKDSTQTMQTTQTKTAQPKKKVPAKPADTKKEDASNKDYASSGKETDAVKAVNKEFETVKAEYSYGIMQLSDGETYIKNTDKIENTAALAPFLADYVSDAIYLGRFDYTTDVGGYKGSYLMDRAFGEGSVDAANLLIDFFGVQKLNNYFAQEGYANTYFGGTVGSDGGSYTTAEDLARLMKKFYENTGFFPYSDMYKKMLANTQTHKIMNSLPSGAYGANMSFTFGEESVDAAIIYTSKGNFVFVAMAEGDDTELEAAHKAMSASAKKICEKIK